MKKNSFSFSDLFRTIAHRISNFVGNVWSFVVALTLIVVGDNRPPVRLFRYLAARYQYRHYHHNLLMVFLIQNTQNRDAKTLHLKLNELVRALNTARNRLVNAEECSEAELNKFQREFRTIRKVSTRRS